MKRPCVAVDVSKSKSHYQGWINIDKKCGNAKCIEHNKIGFQEISNKLKELFVSDKEELKNYTKVLYAQARLIEGLAIDNPTEFSNLVCKLISK